MSYLRFLVCLRIVELGFCFVCSRLVYPMLPVSLDCPFLNAPSVFSKLYYTSQLLTY